MSYKISYGRTFNLGKYESERIDIEQTVDDDLDPMQVYADLKVLVMRMHYDALAECTHESLMTTTIGDVCLRCGELV